MHTPTRSDNPTPPRSGDPRRNFGYPRSWLTDKPLPDPVVELLKSIDGKLDQVIEAIEQARARRAA